MDWILEAWPFKQNQLGTIIINAASLAFFFSLLIYCYRQGTRKRRYIPGIVLVMIASFNGLLRGVFFPTASPHPATLSGFFRLANALLLVVGWIMLEREWRKQRKDSH